MKTMTMRDTQPQREQLESTWAMLANSSGATSDLLQALMDLTQIAVATLRHVDELQGEINELKGRQQ